MHSLSENIKWWSELFELPCVAWNVKKQDEFQTLSEHGADFIALSDTIWNNETSLTGFLDSIK